MQFHRCSKCEFKSLSVFPPQEFLHWYYHSRDHIHWNYARSGLFLLLPPAVNKETKKKWNSCDLQLSQLPFLTDWELCSSTWKAKMLFGVLNADISQHTQAWATALVNDDNHPMETDIHWQKQQCALRSKRGQLGGNKHLSMQYLIISESLKEKRLENNANIKALLPPTGVFDSSKLTQTVITPQH